MPQKLQMPGLERKFEDIIDVFWTAINSNLSTLSQPNCKIMEEGYRKKVDPAKEIFPKSNSNKRNNFII